MFVAGIDNPGRRLGFAIFAKASLNAWLQQIILAHNEPAFGRRARFSK
jgi:hypothetical protein